MKLDSILKKAHKPKFWTAVLVSCAMVAATLLGALAQLQNVTIFDHEFATNISEVTPFYWSVYWTECPHQWSSNYGGSFQATCAGASLQSIGMTDPTHQSFDENVTYEMEYVISSGNCASCDVPYAFGGFNWQVFNRTVTEQTPFGSSDTFIPLMGNQQVCQNNGNFCDGGSDYYCGSVCNGGHVGNYYLVRIEKVNPTHVVMESINLNTSYTVVKTVDLTSQQTYQSGLPYNVPYGGFMNWLPGCATSTLNVLYFKAYTEQEVCEENWVAQYTNSTCLQFRKTITKTYYDSNHCGGTEDLPTDNNTVTTVVCGQTTNEGPSASSKGEVSYCDQSGACYSSLAAAQTAQAPPLSIGGLQASSQGFWDQVLAFLSTGWKGGGFP